MNHRIIFVEPLFLVHPMIKLLCTRKNTWKFNHNTILGKVQEQLQGERVKK